MNQSIPVSVLALFTLLAASCTRHNEANSSGRSRSSAQLVPVVHGVGETGTTKYVFEAQYWGTRNKSKDFVPAPGGGPQPWQKLMKQLAGARTFEEYASCHTEDSRPFLEKIKKALVEQVLTTKNDTDPVTEQYYVTVIVKSEGKERLFIGWADEFVEAEEAGPPFAVLVICRVGENYKIDLTQTGHPVYQSLQNGKWKQFGASKDIILADDSADTPSNERAP